MSRSPEVRLVDVDDPVMERLLELAQLDASADDVTPALGNGTGWTAKRLEWFRPTTGSWRAPRLATSARSGSSPPRARS